MTAKSAQTYLPAAGHDWLLPLYDPLTRLLGVDRARRTLLNQAELQADHRVLDVGCGTGTLAVLIKQAHPSVEVIGLDPDFRALARAEHKAARAGVTVRFDEGFADRLPYRDATFDRVFSSMMFHHLERDSRGTALREMRRVLRPGGRLELLDFERPEAGVHGFARFFHSHQRLGDNSARRLLELMMAAGLGGAHKRASSSMMFGQVAFYQATAP